MIYVKGIMPDLMITDSNQVCLAILTGRRVQEGADPIDHPKYFP